MYVQNERGCLVLWYCVRTILFLTFLTMFILPFNIDTNIVTFSLIRYTFNIQRNSCIILMCILFRV